MRMALTQRKKVWFRVAEIGSRIHPKPAEWTIRIGSIKIPEMNGSSVNVNALFPYHDPERF